MLLYDRHLHSTEFLLPILLFFFKLCVFAHPLPSAWIISSLAVFQGQTVATLPLKSIQYQISFHTDFCISLISKVLKSLIPYVVIT